MSHPTLRTLARLLAPWRTIRRLERANKLLADAIANPAMTGMAIHKMDTTVDAVGPGAQIIAGMFLGLLQDNPKAVNYLQLTFGSPKGPILVTVQRPGGASSHALALRAKAEQVGRRLRAELAELRGEIEAEQEEELHA